MRRKKNRGSSETGEEEPTHSLRHLLVSRADWLTTRESPQGCMYFMRVFKEQRRRSWQSFLQHNFNCSTSMSQVRQPVCWQDLGLTLSARNHRCAMTYFLLVPAPQPGQGEDGQMQRPEVSEEDLSEAKNQLGTSGPAKSKTIQVMEECGEGAQTYDKIRKHAWQTLTIFPRGNRKGNSLLFVDMVEKSQRGSGLVWGRFSHRLSFHSIYRWPGTDVSLLPQYGEEKKRAFIQHISRMLHRPAHSLPLLKWRILLVVSFLHRENGENRSLSVQRREIRGGNRFEHALSSTNQEVAGQLCSVIGQHVPHVRVRQFSTCFLVNTSS